MVNKEGGIKKYVRDFTFSPEIKHRYCYITLAHMFNVGCKCLNCQIKHTVRMFHTDDHRTDL